MIDDKTPYWPDGIPADHASGYEWPAAALVISTKATRNSTMLIEYLRGGGVVTAPLAAYIADLLEGKQRATPKRRKLELTPSAARAAREMSEYYGRLIKAMDRSNRLDILGALKRAGYTVTPDSFDKEGELTKMADHLAAYMLGLTPSAFDRMKNLRGRDKKST